MDQTIRLDNELIDWLLMGGPWVTYRTLTDLLDNDENDNRVESARSGIPEHPLIKKIFGSLNDDGYWGKPKDIHTWFPKKDTTFWILGMLGDFGLSVDDERLRRASEYVFSIQQENGVSWGSILNFHTTATPGF